MEKIRLGACAVGSIALHSLLMLHSCSDPKGDVTGGRIEDRMATVSSMSRDGISGIFGQGKTEGGEDDRNKDGESDRQEAKQEVEVDITIFDEDGWEPSHSENNANEKLSQYQIAEKGRGDTLSLDGEKEEVTEEILLPLLHRGLRHVDIV